MMKRFFTILLMLFSVSLWAAGTGELDLTFNDVGYVQYPVDNSNGVFAGVEFADNGKIFAGGSLGQAASFVAKYNDDGSLDTSYGSNGIASGGPAMNSSVAFCMQSDGKTLVAANDYGRVVRYTVGGSLDTAFGSSGSASTTPPTGYSEFYSRDMVIQEDGKIIIIGIAKISNQFNYHGFAIRYHSNGSLDTTYGLGGKAIITCDLSNVRFQSAALDADQKLVIGGMTNNVNPLLVRLNNNGSLDTSFNNSGYNIFSSIVSNNQPFYGVIVQPDGKIVGVSRMYFQNKIYLLRCNADGSLDTTFADNGISIVDIIDNVTPYGGFVQREDGSFLIAGSGTYQGASNFYLLLCKSNGSLDTRFGSGNGYIRTLIPVGGNLPYQVAIREDGKVFMSGRYQYNEYVNGSYINVQNYAVLLRYNSIELVDPLVDESFGDGGSVSVYADGASSAVAHQEVKGMRELVTGKLMTIVSDGTESWTVRMNADGSYDETYGQGDGIAIAQRAGDETVTDMELGDVGDLMIVGNHAVHGGYLKRVLSDGSMNPLFGGNNGDPIGTVYNIMSHISSVTQLNNGNMLVVGHHNGVGQAVMLSPTGTVVTEFGTNGVYNNGENITSVSVDSDNNIYMAVGYLDSVKKARIIKMSATGVLDPTFGTSGVVNSAFSGIDSYDNIRLALDQNGSVVVAASQVVGTVSVARYNEQGVFDAAFNSGSVYDVVISQDSDVVVTRVMPLENGKIVISGYEDGELDNKWFVVQLTSLGVLDTEYNPDGDIPGMYTFVVSDDEGVAPKNYDGIILSDGNFMFAGSESVATDESTPLIIRVLGNEGVQGVSQYPEIVNVLAVPIFTTFGSGGEIVSNSVPALLSGGFIAFGNQGLTNIGGVTNDSTLIVSRFAKTGEIVTAYGTNGIATSPVITNLVHGGMIAVDGNNKVVVGGYTSDGNLVAVRFTTAGIPDTTFGVSGVVQTSVITNLQDGGFVGVDFNNKVLIGGVTSDGNLVITRYKDTGVLDATFGTGGMATTGVISNLIGGGSLVVNSTTNEMFIAGYTSTGKLVVAKFTSYGSLDTDFGISGIATTGIIDNLIGIGSVTLDAYYRPVVGGYTLYKRLAVARFSSVGTLDTTFTINGFVVTPPISGLVSGGFVDVDNLNRVIVGGLSSILGVKSLVVARFLGTGLVDTTFSPDGLATTGVIENLTEGGPVAVDGVDRILIAGVTIDGEFGSLIGKKLLSGDEIVLAPEEQEAPVDFKIFYYGGNPNLFRRIILVDYYVSLIPDETVRDAVTESINLILSTYTDAFDGQGGFYLTASLSKINFLLQVAENKLIEAYPDNEEEIEQFFTRFQARIDALQR